MRQRQISVSEASRMTADAFHNVCCGDKTVARVKTDVTLDDHNLKAQIANARRLFGEGCGNQEVSRACRRGQRLRARLFCIVMGDYTG
jgi:hypothetical protein